MSVLAEAIASIDYLLERVFQVPIFKVLDPNDPNDLVTIQTEIAKKLQGISGPAEAAALKKALSELDVDWTKLPKSAKAKVFESAKKALNPAKYVLPKVEHVFVAEAASVGLQTKKSAKETFGLKIEVDLNSHDEKALKALGRSQVLFVRDEYGKRSEKFSELARNIVSYGEAHGMGRKDLGRKLQDELGEFGEKRSRAYWNLIAGTFVARARTFSNLSSFKEAYIETYTFDSVLDERTSLVCRFMHGRIFRVEEALASYQKADELEDPEDIKFTQPWVSIGKDPKSGQQFLYHKTKDGDRKTIAHVEEDATGKADEVGKFRSKMSDGALARGGFMFPPLHGHCRSTILPNAEHTQTSVPFALTPSHSQSPPPEEAPAEVKGPSSRQGTLSFGAGGIVGKPVQIFPAIGPPVVALAPSKGKKELALEKLAALKAAKSGTSLNSIPPNDGSWVGIEDEYSDLIDALNSPLAKKGQKKISNLISNKDDVDFAAVENYLKFPATLKYAQTKVITVGKKHIVVDGHEALIANQLLGHESATVTHVNLKKWVEAQDAKAKAAVIKAPPVTPPRSPLQDPKQNVVWKKDEKNFAGEALHGVPLTEFHPGPNHWQNVKDVPLKEPPLETKGKRAGAGLIIMEPDGRIWIVEPKDHYGGYKNTFPKGGQEAGLSGQQNALKEAWEEAGIQAEIVAHLGDFEGDTSVARYYIAKRVGGAPWAFDAAETQAAKLITLDEASKILNKQRDQDILEALKKHPLVTKLPPPPPPPTDEEIAANVLHQKFGAASGSNKGGFYQGQDGVKRYVKEYKDPSQAHVEVLANQIYKQLGVSAPSAFAFKKDGEVLYASKLLEGETLDKGLTKASARKFFDGFMADVLLGNWDAAGMSGDNAMVLKDGSIARIDNGGSLLFRAQGGRKSAAQINGIPELEGFFPGSKIRNPGYHKVALAAGYQNVRDFKDAAKAQVRALSTLRDAHGGWDKFVEAYAPGLPATDHKAIVDMLNTRHALLEKQRAVWDKEDFNWPTWRAPELGGTAPSPKVNLGNVPSAKPPKGYDSYDLPATLPDGQNLAEYEKIAKSSIKAISAASRGAIESFTGSGYRSIRKAEVDESQGLRPDASSKSKADAIADAFKAALPANIGTVYRGLHTIRKATIEEWLQWDDSKGPFRLGNGNVGATSSSSWHAGVSALGGYGAGLRSSPDGHEDSVKVLFQIHHKSGIPIQTISSVGNGEAEILLSRSSEYRVLKVARWDGKKHVYLIELEEI